MTILWSSENTPPFQYMFLACSAREGTPLSPLSFSIVSASEVTSAIWYESGGCEIKVLLVYPKTVTHTEKSQISSVQEAVCVSFPLDFETLWRPTWHCSKVSHFAVINSAVSEEKRAIRLPRKLNDWQQYYLRHDVWKKIILVLCCIGVPKPDGSY